MHGHDLLNKKIKTLLIQWCVDNNKMIYDITRRTEDGKANPLYNFVAYLKVNRQHITHENLKLLNKYGLSFDNNLVSKCSIVHMISRIKTELIPWCEENNKKIYDLKSRNKNGKSNPLYYFVVSIKHNLQQLPSDIVNLLNEYGMVWETRLIKKCYWHTITKRINEELIPWCQQNNKKICDMKTKDKDEKNYSLYNFVYYLRRHADCLSPNVIDLLNEYGIDWTFKPYCPAKTLDEKILDNVIAWHNQTGLPLSKMPHYTTQNNVFYPYTILKLAQKHKDELSIETIAELDRCGMDWTFNEYDLLARKHLISWFNKTQIPLRYMPRHHKNATYYSFLIKEQIRQHKDELSTETIAELDRCGMDWVVKEYDTLAYKHLISWFNKTQIPLRYMPHCGSNKCAFYPNTIKSTIREHKNELSPETTADLNHCGMDWIDNNLDYKVYKYLISWHNQTGIPLSEIVCHKQKKGDDFNRYKFKNKIKNLKNELSAETIVDLDKCGMDWEIYKKVKNTSTPLDDNNTTI